MSGAVTESMGAAYVPFTFPTITVRNNMETAGVRVSSGEVDRLWEAYKIATVDEGLAPYNHEGGGAVAVPLLASLSLATGYTKAKVAGWLNALEKAVKEQGKSWKYLDPAGAALSESKGYSITNPVESLKRAATDLGETAGNLLKPALDPVTNLAKYGALIVVAAAVSYGVYQGAKHFKKARRRRKG